jgi:exodeoxyribonuclease VII large subunit
VQRIRYSVTELTTYIKEKLDSDFVLQDLWVEGEISNWSQSRAGHCYFTVKDAKAAIRAVIWRSAASRLSFSPSDGQAVLVRGHVSVYPPQGQYQLYADDLKPLGRGALYAQFEALKEQLAAEGLFDRERKRQLPTYPQTIGVVTSPTSAALRDMLNILERRWPLVQVILAPSLVQGDAAPEQIVQALEQIYERSVDLIIVGRGGGSIEDLWAFNDERVARTIARAPVPVVSGVGHETDFAIADFVADVRAPTPSAAAELATPDQAEIRGQIASMRHSVSDVAQQRLRDERQAVERLRVLLMRVSPQQRVDRDRQRVDDLQRHLEMDCRHRLETLRGRLDGLQRHMRGLDPRATLERGYAIVRNEGNEIVRSPAQTTPGEKLSVEVAEGTFAVRVTARRRVQDERDGI